MKMWLNEILDTGELQNKVTEQKTTVKLANRHQHMQSIRNHQRGPTSQDNTPTGRHRLHLKAPSIQWVNHLYVLS
jgi:hypothetical protein